VALENVTSFGTEGRRNNPDEEISPSEEIYEYIVFRGTDVKDLRIEETPVQKENKPPQVPNDPAILGVSAHFNFVPFSGAPWTGPFRCFNVMKNLGCKLYFVSESAKPCGDFRCLPSDCFKPYTFLSWLPYFEQLADQSSMQSGSRPPPAKQAQAPQHQTPTPSAPPSAPQGPQAQQHQQPQQQQQHGPPPPGPPFGQHPGYPPFYPPPPGNWGRGGPPGPGFPGMPYGAPPGWYPPPGQGFPPGPFPPYGFPPGPPGQHFQQQQPGQPPKPAPIGPGANKQQATSPAPSTDKQADPKGLAKPAAETAAAAAAKASIPPIASEPSQEVKAAGEQPSASNSAATAATSKSGLSLPKNNGRVQPAIPLASPAAAKAPLQSQPGNVVTPPAAQPTPSNLRDATQAATAAVAAAMAKLPPAGQANGTPMDNLTRKVAEMRTNDPIRAPRQPGSAGGSGFAPGRGGRGRGGARNATQKVEVPDADFDFESSNAKFNKQDLVKEAIAGSPLGEEAPASSPTEPDAPVVGYNKSTSFFDNISSESKDRSEASNGRAGGREWRGEEQKKNVETFGQGSVDNGYRGGYRGRGRGRGGYRGRGYGGNGQPRGRGGYRGRGDQAIVQ
jgi:protein LSM14